MALKRRRRRPSEAEVKAVLHGTLKQLPLEGLRRLVMHVRSGGVFCQTGSSRDPEGVCGCPLVEALPPQFKEAVLDSWPAIALELAWLDLGVQLSGNPKIPVKTNGTTVCIAYSDVLPWVSPERVRKVALELLDART